MYLKLLDEFIECDRVFGPMPNFQTSFEKYFISKAYNLLLREQQQQPPNDHDKSCTKYIVSSTYFFYVRSLKTSF